MLFRRADLSLLVGVAATFLVAAADCMAQAYPNKPVRVIVPASPGGGSDLIARIVAAPLGNMLGQPFVVENRVTSGGIIGAQQVAQSAPDGYTLLVTFDTFVTNQFLFKNLQWDPVKSFAPVMQICVFPQVLLVHPGVGVKNLQEFVALAKQRGADLNYGTAGQGSSSRLAYELFKSFAKIETVAIHYKGGGPAIQDLIAGQVQVMLVQGGGAIQQSLKAERLVALAVSTASRSPLYPGVPAIAETYPGFESQSWVGMFAPAGTPKAIIDKLHSSLVKILAEPGMKERFATQAAEIVASTPEVLGRVVLADQAKWGKIVRSIKIELD
jgi:tripartite-type tricarboxylate transporter receptor subunit TctC